ncbi:single-stranded DNA-binding protein [Spirochaetia bacterium]|nr:single-stranded DNA-binding protein [Spirochaetia bacterium]
MADINHVVLVGRLTRDSELKYTANGQPVTKFSIAVNRSVKKGEKWEEETSYFDIVLWGKRAESLNQYLIKGKQIGVDGELRQDRWEQDGKNHSKVEVIASNINLLGGGAGAGSSGESRGSFGASGGNSSNGQPFGPPKDVPPSDSDDGFADDIPF